MRCEGEELPFENCLKIDNTNLAPDETAKMIKAYFAIEEQSAERSILQ